MQKPHIGIYLGVITHGHVVRFQIWLLRWWKCQESEPRSWSRQSKDLTMIRIMFPREPCYASIGLK